MKEWLKKEHWFDAFKQAALTADSSTDIDKDQLDNYDCLFDCMTDFFCLFFHILCPVSTYVPRIVDAGTK